MCCFAYFFINVCFKNKIKRLRREKIKKKDQKKEKVINIKMNLLEAGYDFMCSSLICSLLIHRRYTIFLFLLASGE